MKTKQQMKDSVEIKSIPIVIVKFNDGSEHFFGSLSAIYQVFTPQQIGITLRTLWKKKVTDKQPYAGKYCTISRSKLIRMAHKQ